jgi:Helix-turn-helix domain
MLTIALVNEIDRLLHEGELSQRQIAARLGVSRGTIGAIANGQRGLFGRDPTPIHSPLVHSTPPRRCPKCGYRVYLPCLVCRIRDHKQRQAVLQLIAANREQIRRARKRRSLHLRAS